MYTCPVPYDKKGSPWAKYSIKTIGPVSKLENADPYHNPKVIAEHFFGHE